MILELALGLAGVIAQAIAPAPCSSADAPTGTFAVHAVSARQDSTIRVSVCLATPAGRRVGSYHGELLFSAAAVRLLAVEAPRDGIRAQNALVPGKVSFAGAVPNGLNSDALITVVLRAPAGDAPALAGARLHLVELNDTAGLDVLGDTRVDSVVDAAVEVAAAAPCGRHPRAGRPVLERLSPNSVSVSSSTVTLEIIGCGFDRTNTVIVGATRIAGVASANAGTRLRVTVNLAARGGGEVAPMPARPGPQSVVVSNAHGRSNALSLVVQ